MVEKVDEQLGGSWWKAAGTRSEKFPRIEHLRNAVWSKNPTGGNWPEGTMLSLEKVFWYTKVWTVTDG